jgi:selenocysteine lyase/cysteine desulfurase
MSLPNHPIYLDNHATTPVDPRVIQAMRPFWEAQFTNPPAPNTPWAVPSPKPWKPRGTMLPN